MAESARNHAANGFSGIKLRLGKEIGPAAQAERAKVAIEAAGPDVAVMVDGTESWTCPNSPLTKLALDTSGLV